MRGRLSVGKRNRPLAAVVQNLDQASVGFQSHPKHGVDSSVAKLRTSIADSPWIQ
jgi:hypothetical protein